MPVRNNDTNLRLATKRFIKAGRVRMSERSEKPPFVFGAANVGSELAVDLLNLAVDRDEKAVSLVQGGRKYSAAKQPQAPW